MLRLLCSSRGVVDENALSITIAEIQDALTLESEQKGWMDLLKDDHVRSRRRVFLACLLNACQAWSGSTPISYYTTVMYVIFLTDGIEKHDTFEDTDFLKI